MDMDREAFLETQAQAQLELRGAATDEGSVKEDVGGEEERKEKQ